MAELIPHDAGKVERILSVTRDMLLRHGIRGVTVAEIAKRAHVGKGTVYLYWSTKEDLFLGVLTRDFVAVHDEFITRLNGDPAQIHPDRMCPLMIRTAMSHPFVRALQVEDTETLGLLLEHPRTRELTENLSPGAVLSMLLPLWRTHGMTRADKPIEEQMYMLRALMSGFFELATTAGGPGPAIVVANPDAVFAETVRTVLGQPDTIAPGRSAEAAEAAARALCAAREKVTAAVPALQS